MSFRLGDSLKSDPWLWLAGLVSAALLLVMNLRDAAQFAALTHGRTIPDSDISSTGESLLALKDYLATKPEAAEVLRTMHLQADLVLPAALTIFLLLLIRRLVPGAIVYGRPAESLLAVMMVFPILYGLADYSENVIGLLLFPPSSPTAASAALLADALSWATRLKFLAATIAGVIIARLLIARLAR
ncbi:hypothetical protein [Rhizobium sp. C4]|uniref:hypothetical protein n=1 Tax=Rhizobium sp. C4 TaxID=1349800 RepID=UPI001E62793A|nr:hypothetical protein [Rhizobium sp. C4]MCD2172761.1 hypothetical protein [Rhizobium sp. C4]